MHLFAPHPPSYGIVPTPSLQAVVSRLPAAPAGIAGPVTDATWKELVLESKVPVLVDFWAPWCGPCRMIAPLIDEIAQEYGSKIVAVRLLDRTLCVQLLHTSAPHVCLRADKPVSCHVTEQVLAR